jgi:hypothetical protein
MWEHYKDIKSKIRENVRLQGQVNHATTLHYDNHPDLLQEEWEAVIKDDDDVETRETICVHSLIQATGTGGAGVVHITDMS